MSVGRLGPSGAVMAARPVLDHPWFEAVALRAASRRAAKLSTEARARMKPWVVGARARYRVARELRDAASQVVALGLLKEAALFALRALECASSELTSAAGSPQQAWQRFESLADEPPGAPEQLTMVRAAFSTDDALSLDLIAASQANEANELRLAAEASVAWLLSLVEIRTPAELVRARLVRSALAVLAIVAVSSCLVAYWLSLRALEPR